ncbi:MAG: hypothetical protein RIF41_28070, partial [Polyangiaceae bacterium]
YSHSLKMHEEALEDITNKKAELHHHVERKRLELLELKRAQLAQRQQRDEALENVIAELSEQVARYQPPARAIEPPKSGLVQLKKKSKQGGVVAIDAAE